MLLRSYPERKVVYVKVGTTHSTAPFSINIEAAKEKNWYTNDENSEIAELNPAQQEHTMQCAAVRKLLLHMYAHGVQITYRELWAWVCLLNSKQFLFAVGAQVNYVLAVMIRKAMYEISTSGNLVPVRIDLSEDITDPEGVGSIGIGRFQPRSNETEIENDKEDLQQTGYDMSGNFIRVCTL